jgi:hypothetical protein
LQLRNVNSFSLRENSRTTVAAEIIRFSSIHFLFIYVQTYLPKGQLQSEHEQGKRKKHINKIQKKKAIYII